MDIGYLVSAEGIESARQRNFNDLDGSRWYDIPHFRCKAARTARKRHGIDFKLIRRPGQPAGEQPAQASAKSCYRQLRPDEIAERKVSGPLRG